MAEGTQMMIKKRVQKTKPAISRTSFPSILHNRETCDKEKCINPFNAELHPICHLLVLLGDLTFMGQQDGT
jgi:hypothetical protein